MTLTTLTNFDSTTDSSVEAKLREAKASVALLAQENFSLRKRFDVLADESCDLFIRFSCNRQVLAASKKTALLFQDNCLQLIGSSLLNLFDALNFERLLAAINQTFLTGESQSVRSCVTQRDTRWFQLRTSALEHVDGTRQVLLTGHDITEFKSIESSLTYQAMHDSLTGLPNRCLMEDRIRREIELYKRTAIPFAVVVMDLDGFKKINDSLGHAAGDEVLKQTAVRLSDLLRGTDTVARMGGDEFVLVLPGVGCDDDLEPVLRRVLGAIQQPFMFGNDTLHLTTSLGAAIHPYTGESLPALLSNADRAMYKSKERGKDQWCSFKDQLIAKTTQIVTMEAALYDGVRNGEFLLHYQPICEAATGRIAGVEALMRWMRPGHGLVSPADFIPVVEANGLINLLGAWALKMSAMQLAHWDAQGLAPVYASVNVSPRQFRHSRFLFEVRKALTMSQVDPSRLVLEITEGVLMKDPETARQLLNELVAMGLRISVDDFGTGYSSLAYLQKFPLCTLKVDRSFVQNLPENAHDAAIVDAILALARGTGLQVVAEGVELEAQRSHLAQRGCEFVQGWLTGRPQPAMDIARLLLPSTLTVL